MFKTNYRKWVFLELLDNFNKRRGTFFQHKVFLCAKFLDPRYNFELLEHEKGEVIQRLNLYNKMQVGAKIHSLWLSFANG